MRLPICNDSRKCFAKMKDKGKDYCTALDNTYEDGLCPFCKTKVEEIKKYVRSKSKN